MTKGMNTQIVNEAANWAVRVDAGALSPAERADLANWLNASPVHIGEFLTASAMLSGVVQAQVPDRIDLADLMEHGSADIVSLPFDKTSHRGSSSNDAQSPLRFRTVWTTLVAIFAFGFIVIAATRILQPAAPNYETHMTALGEQRTFSLEDGSLVHLNTQSQIRVAFSETDRRAELIKGEALFDIKSDPDRPFKVTAGDTVAEALGTVFNVRLFKDSAVVSVVEGKVRVDQRDAKSGYRVQSVTQDSASSPALPQTLDSVVLTDGKTARLNSKQRSVDLGEEDLETITSWRERKIVFERRPLAWIVDEFNRYNRSKLVIADDDLKEAQFTGTFDADDPQSFVMFLEQHHNVSAITVGRNTHIRQK